MPVEEYIYVLSGALAVNVGEPRTVLEANDALYYRADAPHRFETEGRSWGGSSGSWPKSRWSAIC
ncbi:cupin domain-containing protein [Paraburkholderia fungorum]|uniref:cupin domain-containing protein n=1 Tax=Paraburkholderia fungorum TaxID=134537 RepID=UPI003CD0C870